MKWKLNKFYEGKAVRIGEDVMPFPGASLLRWVIYDARNKGIKYEGKPSFQAIEKAERLYKLQRKKLILCEFDRGGPIAKCTLFGRALEIAQVNWNLWPKYHGDFTVQDVYLPRRKRNVPVPKNAQAR